MIQKIKPEELNSWKSSHTNHLIIDVREPYEFEDFNIGGKNIPLETVLDNISQVPEDQSILLCCKSGNRSAAMAHTIQRKLNRVGIFTLEGGIEALNSFNA